MNLLVNFLILTNFKLILLQQIKDQEPKGIHLLAANRTEVDIIWWTQGPITSAIVFYSLVDLNDDHIASDSLFCRHEQSQKGIISRTDTFGKFIHRVRLYNLVPGRRYCYEIQSGIASSHIYTFRTSEMSINIGTTDQIESDEPDFVNSYFIVNSNNFETNKIKQDYFKDEEDKESISFLIESIRYQLFNKKILSFIDLQSSIKLSDYARADGPKLDPTQQGSYEKDFLDFFNEILSQAPILNVYQRKETVLHNSMFGAKQSLVYSVDLNGVHFFTYDQSSDSDGIIEEIENDLIKANQNRHFTPWIILYLPKNFVCEKVEAVLFEYNIDLVIVASDSFYERSFPVLESIGKYKLTYDEPEMPFKISLPNKLFNKSRESLQPRNWTSFLYQPLNDYTYGMLKIVNKTYLKWFYVHSNESIIDEFEFVKNHNDAFERVYNHRIEFLNKNFGLNLKSKMVPDIYYTRPSDVKYTKIALFVLTVTFILCSIAFLLHYFYRRNLRLKLEMKYKFTNYTNLIESEFDAS
ncbi:acid phosphatase type 7 isoform X1 [Brachionus plicatilis]|uniref:Acid phosphatase type 7 isoform X1 n=1 Tax=Brachionus plicatilis TaxID=10195 RepID=A0A3M7SPY2_BRAPC|nr:acid phosphatase type 7 isoform X1 [Brachionus plicatilis]